MIRAALLALAFAPLAACGFTPVYGGGAGFANGGQIAVNEIEGRTGHYLRQELVRSIGPGVPGFTSKGVLSVTLGQKVERLAFAPDQAASRSDYVGNATWTLRGADGTIIGTGTVNERASFNFANAAYSDLAAQTAAQERLAGLLARSIRLQMIAAAGRPVSEPAAAPLPPPKLPGQ